MLVCRFLANSCFAALLFLVTPNIGATGYPNASKKIRVQKRGCAEALTAISYSPENRNVKLKSLDDVILAFSKGLVPNLNDDNQATAFALYLATAFGASNNRSQMPDVGFGLSKEVLEEFPSVINQPRFRNIEIVYNPGDRDSIPHDLEELTDRLHRTARRTQANFSNVSANIGFYRKILRDPKLQAEQWIQDNNLSLLNDTSVPLKAKNTALFKVLMQAYHSQQEAAVTTGSPPVPALGLALADLIHNVAVLSGSSLDHLKGTRSETRLRAIKRILQDRDELAISLGLARHYDEILKITGAIGPTGTSSPREIEKLSARIEGSTLWLKPKNDSSDITRTVRHLTVLEKPNRSCLGGSDCSSFTYFKYGFEPATQYFTLTDRLGRSSGQVTVVLGHLKNSKGESRQVAFLDKVQNVPTAALLPMLEAIRISLSEFGFPLYLGNDQGEHDGLSNDSSTTEAYRTILELMSPLEKAEFEPLSTTFGFGTGYSRAYGRTQFFTPFVVPHEITIRATAADIDRPWKTTKLSEKATVDALLKMKDGSDIERGKYTTLMPIIEAVGLRTFEEHQELLVNWMADKKLSVRLRGDVMLIVLDRYRALDHSSDGLEELGDLLKKFDPFLPILSEADREALSNRFRARGTEEGDPEVWDHIDLWLLLLNWDHPERVSELVRGLKFNEMLSRATKSGSKVRELAAQLFQLQFGASPDLVKIVLTALQKNPELSWEAVIAKSLAGNEWSTDQKIDFLQAIENTWPGLIQDHGDYFESFFVKMDDGTYQELVENLKKRDLGWLPTKRPQSRGGWQIL